MSNIQKVRVLPSDGAIAGASVRLNLISATLYAELSYEKQIVINPGTDAEEVFSISTLNERKSLSFNAQSDEQMAALLNLKQDGKAMLEEIDAETRVKHALKGVPDAVKK